MARQNPTKRRAEFSTAKRDKTSVGADLSPADVKEINRFVKKTIPKYLKSRQTGE